MTSTAFDEPIRKPQGRVIEVPIPDAPNKKPRLTKKPPKITDSMLFSSNGFPKLKEDFHKLNFYTDNGKLTKKFDHELENLNILMKFYDSWFRRMCPGISLENGIEQLEKLTGKALVRHKLQQLELGLEEQEEFQVYEKPQELDPVTDINEADNSIPKNDKEGGTSADLTADQLARIESNKRRALERMQRKKQQSSVAGNNNNNSDHVNTPKPTGQQEKIIDEYEYLDDILLNLDEDFSKQGNLVQEEVQELEFLEVDT